MRDDWPDASVVHDDEEMISDSGQQTDLEIGWLVAAAAAAAIDQANPATPDACIAQQLGRRARRSGAAAALHVQS